MPAVQGECDAGAVAENDDGVSEVRSTMAAEDGIVASMGECGASLDAERISELGSVKEARICNGGGGAAAIQLQ